MSKNKKPKNLEYYTKNISGKILDSIALLDVLEEITEDKHRNYILIEQIQDNLNSAFRQIERCRHIISVPE